jgi:perosamine synthetase
MTIAERKEAAPEPERFVKVASPQIDDDDVRAVEAALRSGVLTSGPKVREFEERFAAYVGVSEAVAMNSGTAALHAALAACEVGPGDEVIVPALSFFSSATAVIHAGAVPVFCDISLENFCMDPEDLERHITPRTKALMPVHYFGHCAEMDEINAVAERHGLTVIEDCAQSHGSTYRGRQTGSLADMGAFSLFATKHMTTCEGGVVTTDSSEHADYMRKFRSHGLVGRDDHVLLGYNYRLPEPLGALGCTQIEKLDGLNDARIRNSEALISRIEDIAWLQAPIVPPHVRHTYFWCHILIDEEQLGMSTSDLIRELASRGVEVRRRYTAPLYKQPLLTTNLPPILELSAGPNLPDYGALDLPNSELAAGRVIGLPNRPDMSDGEIEYVAEVLHAVAQA